MKPHTYRFVFAALLLTMLAIFGIAFTADSEPQNSSLKTDGIGDAKLVEEKMMSKEERIVSKDKKILVVCYSFSRGNTRKIARELQTALDADYAEIEPVVPYPPYGGWNSEVTEQGKREVEAGFMPEIKPLAVNIADRRGNTDLVVYHGAPNAHFPEIAGLDGQDGHSLYDARRLARACNHGHQGILRRGKICLRYGNTV